MGFWFTDARCIYVAPRALSNHVIKLNRLYEQAQKLPADMQATHMMSYLTRCSVKKITHYLEATSSKLLLEVKLTKYQG